MMCSVTEGSWGCTNRRWVSEQKGAGGRLRIGSGGRTTVRPETRRALTSLGLRMGQWVAFLAPVLGLFVFWLLALAGGDALCPDCRAGDDYYTH